VGDQGKAAKSSEFRKSTAPTLRTSRDVIELENLAGRPQVDIFYSFIAVNAKTLFVDFSCAIDADHAVTAHAPYHVT